MTEKMEKSLLQSFLKLKASLRRQIIFHLQQTVGRQKMGKKHLLGSNRKLKINFILSFDLVSRLTMLITHFAAFLKFYALNLSSKHKQE